MLRRQTGEGLPPAEIRFTELRVEPWADGRRIRVHVTLTPFQQKPNLEASIKDETGHEVSFTSIIETAENRFVFTMHIRSASVSGKYTLTASLNYQDLGTIDEKSISFSTQELPDENTI